MAQFGDLSVFLKKHFHASLYKKTGETISTVENRVIKMNKLRRSNRHEAIFEKRKIPENMSPVVTPVQTPVKRRKSPAKIATQLKSQEEPKVQQANKRFEMLLKWKAEREKKKAAEKRHVKPVFKVSCVPVNVGLPNLEMVNKEIKGKPFKSKFAPVNHQFKPPSNIKPIHFHNAKTQQKSPTKKNNGTTPRRMVTRSQTRTNSSVKFENSVTLSTKAPKVKSTQKKTKKSQSYKTDSESTLNLIPREEIIQNKEKTPIRKEGEPKPPMYISPFVTVSRSKEKARKEFEARRSGKSFSAKLDHDACSSPKAGAAYFRWLLGNQIIRLQGICDEWTNYKDDLNPPEEAVSMIDVAIGQTNLLISKKFQQFKGLIDKCEGKDTETPVTCEDLHGFWDMMHLQIDNLDKRFENLCKLKMNNWEEILPVVKNVVKQKSKKAKNVKASAGLRAAIQAARKKKLENQESLEERKTPKNRNSTRLSVLKSQEKSQTKTSPGLMMMKVAQYAKTVETPAKSILRTDTHKSGKSHSKSVLFKDEIDTSVDNVENDLNKSNSVNKCKSSRRSGRLIRSKLF